MYTHLDEIFRERREALRLSVDEIAAQVRSTGFQCIRCGKCCRGEDAVVFVFPSEIRRIISQTGEGWLEVAGPPATGEWDHSGDYHTLEWHLGRMEDRCRYHSDEGCRIYGSRPALCRTYPFYLDGGVLRVSECDGLGRAIGLEDARELAKSIVDRYVRELHQAAALVARYEDFIRGKPSRSGVCVVHDGEGEHRILWKRVPGLLELCCRNPPAEIDR